ncbi:MAG: acetolactate synthase [Dehalococcoidales bacterium]|nr:acetolactate synthase [Dehalococcoidales bacterium]
MAVVNGGYLVAKALKAEGVKYIFTLCGGSILPIYEGCVSEGIGIIDFRHEQSAAFAAQAWAKVTGKPGVVVATAGPGVTNIVTAVAGAFRDAVPLIAIGGRSRSTQWDMDPPQDLDHLAHMRPITKWARSVLETQRIPEYMSMAFRQAIGPRSGPVFLEMPENVLESDIEEAVVPFPVRYRTAAGAQGAPDLVKEAVKLLAQAERPVIIAGGNIWWSQAYRELQKFAELSDAPVFLVGMGRGSIPYGHRLLFNCARRFAMTQADVVAVLGTPIDFRLGYGQPPLFRAEAKVIQVDLEPEDIGHNRDVAVGIYGDMKAILRQLVQETTLVCSPSREQWVQKVRKDEIRNEQEQEPLLNSDAMPIHPLRLCREIRDFVDKDATIIGDGGDFISFAARVLRIYHPGHWLDPGTLGGLGFGPGAAVAAKLAQPEKQVLLLSGDGTFGFSGMEFDTMVRMNLPIVCVIGNDAKWGQVKAYFQETGKTPIAVDLSPRARYDKVVEALGGYGEMVEKPEEIRPALERAFACGRPACLNVMTAPEVFYGARSYKAYK